MSKKIIFFSAVFLLSGCAYIMESPIQDLTVETPGARDTLCYVYVDGYKYKYHPPETISITKTREDVIVDCLAPGNRRKKVVIEADVAAWTAANIFNGGLPGISWDMGSGAMYKFPEKVIVDFSDLEPVPEALPAQNNPDIKQPEEYRLEEFRPSQMRMNDDPPGGHMQIKKRERNTSSSYGDSSLLNEGGPSYEGQIITPGSSGSNSKSAPNPALLNPSSSAPSAPAGDAPVPLYAGD